MKKLVGEGKPFHSAVDKTAALLKRKVGTGAEFMKELMGVSGIKPTELQERGLTDIMGMPKMTHDQFMAALASKSAPAIQEKVLGEKPDPADIIRRVNAHARTSASNYAESADTSREAREMKADELRRLRENHRPQMTQFARHELEGENQPHHYGYTLPGGDNYREMLIKAPKGVDNEEKIMELEAKLRRAPNTNNQEQDQWNKLYNQIRDLKAQQAASPEPFKGVSGHFGGEPNILASMRLKDRIVPGDMGYTLVNKKSGNKSQHYATAEEAQAAMQNMPESMRPMLSIQQSRGPDKKLLHLEELQSDWHQQGRDRGYGADWKVSQDDNGKFVVLRNGRQVGGDGFDNESMAQRALEIGQRNDKVVPDAPFKKNWEEMALKRLIHHAAEKGYHGIVVTPGEEQAKRYNIGDRIGYLGYHPEEERLKAYDHDRREVMNQTGIKKEDLPSHIGKEVADRLLKAPQMLGTHQLEGEDIHVGGEGMKGFYDKKVPNILNSIGKKYGVKVGKTAINTPKETPWDIGDAASFHGMTGAQYLDHPNRRQLEQQFLQERNKHTTPVHHFPITEEMRKDVLTNGLSLYNKGGTVHMADGGDMDQMQLEMMNKKIKQDQTVKNAQRTAYPGIYGNPKDIAALAASRVAEEDPALKLLFGVTRADMYQQAKDRKGMPHLGMLPGAAANPKGSMAAEGVMNPRNEQRLIDVMAEAQKHQGLVHGMEPWYYMDPLFNHMVKLLGLQKATEEYKKMNSLMGMASSSSEVNTEIPRGSLAYWLQNQGRFNEFVKHGGKRSEDRPADFGDTPGHLAHKTAHALPMQKFLERGEVDMNSPKVPMYIEASGVPATGFQTRTPVGDAHWSRAVGLADTRNPKTIKGKEVVPGASVSTPEMSSLGPWWQKNIASKLGLESVPAQALTWGAFSPQTGVTTPIGAPKLELIAKQIMQTANRLGVSPQTARDMVLTGKERMGKAQGGPVHMADGGQVDIKNIGVNEAPNMDVKQFFAPRPMTTGVLPVGGVQQPPQPPQQMQQQAPQGPQGMPQDQAPAQPPQGQPPSNILQMTPQGQAMNAIKPPQMARGGHIDRDTMMLALINRKMKVNHG